MKLLNMVQDDGLALKYGYKWCYQKYAAAEKLEAAAASAQKPPNEEQLHKISRKPYLHAMWRRAYRLTFPKVQVLY